MAMSQGALQLRLQRVGQIVLGADPRHIWRKKLELSTSHAQKQLHMYSTLAGTHTAAYPESRPNKGVQLCLQVESCPSEPARHGTFCNNPLPDPASETGPGD